MSYVVGDIDSCFWVELFLIEKYLVGDVDYFVEYGLDVEWVK